MSTFEMKPVATVHSDYQEKFAIPRQPNLAPAARAWLQVDPYWVQQGALEGLEQASHLWLQFVFHAVKHSKIKGRVRPPRLGGNQKMGVFATRSTHRPNALGLSVVQLVRVQGERVFIAGADLLDGTPVLDIKPYLPWSDSLPLATHAFAGDVPEFLEVEFSTDAQQALNELPTELGQRLKSLLEQSLGQDPRPAYQRDDPHRVYGVRMANCEVRWRHPNEGHILVLSIEPSN